MMPIFCCSISFFAIESPVLTISYSALTIPLLFPEAIPLKTIYHTLIY